MTFRDEAIGAMKSIGLPQDEAEAMYEDFGSQFEPDEDEEVCEHCDGTGEVTVMETVWAGEPHQAPTGTRKCICVLGDGDYED